MFENEPGQSHSEKNVMFEGHFLVDISPDLILPTFASSDNGHG